MDKNLTLDFVRITEEAAIAAARWVGKGRKNLADQAAVTAMRKGFNSLDINATIVIGEGERDKAPMLYIGEKVGTGKGMEIDIAVDPLECTNSVAYGRPNAIAVLAAAPKGCLFAAPDIYMNKIAVGPKAKGAIDLDLPIKKNIENVAKALDKDVEEVTIIMLDRERHQKMMEEVREVGARIFLITDGDVAGGIAPSLDYSGIDMLLGIGASPEGVLTASALRCLGGEIQGRLHFKNEEEKRRAKEMGIKQLDKKLYTEDLAKGDHIFFCATGVNSGPILRGVNFTSHGAITHSLVMRKKTQTKRFVETHHTFGNHKGTKESE